MTNDVQEFLLFVGSVNSRPYFSPCAGLSNDTFLRVYNDKEDAGQNDSLRLDPNQTAITPSVNPTIDMINIMITMVKYSSRDIPWPIVSTIDSLTRSIDRWKINAPTTRTGTYPTALPPRKKKASMANPSITPAVRESPPDLIKLLENKPYK